MSDRVTYNLSSYIKAKGITTAAVIKATGIPPNALYPSLTNKRSLRVDEFFKICDFIEEDPKRFYSKDTA